jgi:hypothetical protein
MNGNPGKFERMDFTNLDPWPVFLAEGKAQGIDEATLRAEHERLLSQEVWRSHAYQVSIDRDPPHGFKGLTLWHLSIRRSDRKAVHDWRDLQAIKNALAGPQYDAIELYPAASRTVDGANQYHLWVFVADESMGDKAPRLPVGWFTRNVDTDTSAFPNAKQRGLHNNGATL